MGHPVTAGTWGSKARERPSGRGDVPLALQAEARIGWVFGLSARSLGIRWGGGGGGLEGVALWVGG